MTDKNVEQRRKQVFLEGYVAYSQGSKVNDNPYKESEWGLGRYWLRGWNKKHNELKNRFSKSNGRK